MLRVTVLAVLTVLTTCMVCAAPAQATLWMGVGNIDDANNLNFGYSATNYANGGTGPTGEVGGMFSFQTSGAHYYGWGVSTLDFSKSFEINWNSTDPAKMYYDNDGSYKSDNAVLAFFDRDKLATGSWPNGTGLPYVGVRLGGGSTTAPGQAICTYYTGVDSSWGNEVTVASSVVTQTTHTFRLKYDPTEGSYGRVSCNFDGTVYTMNLSQGDRNSGAAFNTFGLWQPQSSGWTAGANVDHVYFGNIKAFADGVPIPMDSPEPSSLVLMGAGVFGLLAYAWRKRR